MHKEKPLIGLSYPLRINSSRNNETILMALLLSLGFFVLYMGKILPFPGTEYPEPHPIPDMPETEKGEEASPTGSPQEKLVWCEKHQTMHWPPACR